jgi:hypothetical protein
MNTRLRVLLVFLGALLVAATYSFPYWLPLLEQQSQGNQVSLGLPPELEALFRILPPDQQRAYLRIAEDNPETARQIAFVALGPATEIPESDQEMPTMVDAQIAASGEFTSIDPIRWARGTATIYEASGNVRVLRLEDFESANAPELHVMLSASPNPLSQAEVELNDLQLDLGALQGNLGSQNYNIPLDVDLEQYNSVVLYSQSLNMVFSTAPLFTSF